MYKAARFILKPCISHDWQIAQKVKSNPVYTYILTSDLSFDGGRHVYRICQEK